MIERTIVESIEYTINETRLYLIARIPENPIGTWQKMKRSATEPLYMLLAILYTNQQIDTEKHNYLGKLIDEVANIKYQYDTNFWRAQK